jgi:dipeptidyl aminopeptidase/acylaminoacyl peptidase
LQGQGWVGKTSIHASAAWSSSGEALVIWAYSDPTPDEPQGGQHVYLVSPRLDSPAAVHVGDNQRSLGPVAWSPDGERFALASGTTLAAVDLRGQVLWSTDIPGSSIANVRWSPDGHSISVHAFPLAEEIDGRLYPGRNPAVYVLDARTDAIDFRLWGASACWGEVWTADGRSLIVAGQRSDEFGWFVVTADGTSVRRLDAADGAFFVEPSPTNPGIAAFLGRPTYPNGNVGPVEGPLMSLDLRSGAAKPVLYASPEAQPPEWDPAHSPRRWLSDGRLVFFTGDGGHGGCEMGPRRPNLEVQFPPFDAGD